MGLNWFGTFRVLIASLAMRLNLGPFGFLPTTYAKINEKQMRSRSSRRAAFCTCLFSRSDRVTCRQQTHLTYPRGRTTAILINRKIRIPANSAPCPDQDGAGSGVSGVFLGYKQSTINRGVARHLKMRGRQRGWSKWRLSVDHCTKCHSIWGLKAGLEFWLGSSSLPAPGYAPEYKNIQ